MGSKIIKIALLCLLPMLGYGQLGLRKTDTTIVATVDGQIQQWKTWDHTKNALDLKQNSQSVNILDFGADSTGVADATTAIQQAITYARSKMMPLYIPSGTYKFSPTSPVELSGIPRIFGSGTIDARGAAIAIPNQDNGYVVFSVKGTKQLVQAGSVNTRQDSTKTVINTGLSLSPGDFIWIVSNEPWLNASRGSYLKGCFAVVDKYNSTTGQLVVFQPFNSGMTTGYLYKSVNRPKISVDKGLIFLFKNSNSNIAFDFQYAEVQFDARIEGAGFSAIQTVSTLMHSSNAVMINNGYPSNGNAYGVAVCDMSQVYISNAVITGGRHAVVSGGDLWNKNESGGADEKACYPSSYFINGGTYSVTDTINSTGAIDAHGISDIVNVSNATINGGVNLNARINLFTNNYIANGVWPLMLASDPTPSLKYGYYKFEGNTLFMANPQQHIFQVAVAGGTDKMIFRNNTIIGKSPELIKSILYITAPYNYLEIDGFTSRTDSRTTNGIILSVFGTTILKNIYTNNIQWNITTGMADVDFTMENVNINNSGNHGLILQGISARKFNNVRLTNVSTTNSVRSGILFSYIRNYVHNGGKVANNNTGNNASWIIGEYAVDSVTVATIRNVDYKATGSTFQTIPLRLSFGTPSITIQNNDWTGSSSGALISGSTNTGSYGNIGTNSQLVNQLVWANYTITGALPAVNGGTGIASYTAGNYVNAATSTTLQQRTPAQVLSDIGGAPINNTSLTGITKVTVVEYADNAAAVTAGLAIGSVYRTGDLLKVVH